MMRQLKQSGSKCDVRGNGGFTLVETLVALLILTMISVIVATGVPSAINTYRNAVASSNAQVALSTVATALRVELGSATKVESSTSGANGTITYLCGEGYWARLSNGAGTNLGPVKKTADTLVGVSEWTLVPNKQLATTQDELYVSYDSITFDNGVFKVNGLKVVQVKNGVRQTTALAEIDANAGTGSSGYLAISAPYCKVAETGDEDLKRIRS